MSNDHAVIIDGHLRLLGTYEECQREYILSLAAYRPEYHDKIKLFHMVEVMVGGLSKQAWADRYTPSVAEPVADKDALLRERIDQLCEALLADYNRTGSNFGTSYAPEYKAGQKYVRIVHGTGSQRSVHAFVEMATGALVKAAGWKAPAKRADGRLQSQYNLLDDASFAKVLNKCDWSGRYLYVR
jgi:hypothetical protein